MMGDRRRLEREIRGVAASTPPRVPVDVLVSEVERWLDDLMRLSGPVRATMTTRSWWRRRGGGLDYAAAEPWEVVARLGAREVANVLIQRDPVGYARWRSEGRRAYGEAAEASAYLRLARLVEQGWGWRAGA